MITGAPSVSRGLTGATLLDREKRLFVEDYRRFHVVGETKPPSIGEPYLLRNPSSGHGVLLVHGLMAAPAEVRELAEYLYQIGYTVYAPRMAGHGTSSADLSRRSAREWIASVDRGYDILRAHCERIVAAGFSTGGAIVMNRVVANPGTFSALVTISAPLWLKKLSARFAAPVHRWNRALESLGATRLRKDFVPNLPDNPHINYDRCPVSSIAEIKRLMRSVVRGLPSVTIPSLVMHATGDPKVDVRSAREIHRRIGACVKHYREIDFHEHGIVRGAIAAEVFAEVGAFLRRHAPATG